MTDSLQSDSATEPQAEKPLNVKLLTCGFGSGLIVGAIFLFGGSNTVEQTADTVQKTPQATAAQSSEESRAAQESSAGREAHRPSETLALERQQLEAELETLKLKHQISELRQRLTTLETSPVSTSAPEAPSSPGSEPADPAPVASGKATLDYWNKMNEIIARETQMRMAPLGGITSANAGSFLKARVRAAECAVESLQNLDPGQVDHRAVAVAKSVAEWYEQGQKVAETGHDLLTRGSRDQRQGTAGKQYQAAERQHAKAVESVNAEGERVRQQLSKKYGMNFPPLK